MMVELSFRGFTCSIMFCGKAYVRGYEFEKLGTTFKDLNKAEMLQQLLAGYKLRVR